MKLLAVDEGWIEQTARIRRRFPDVYDMVLILDG
jgi:hypothetical protein